VKERRYIRTISIQSNLCLFSNNFVEEEEKEEEIEENSDNDNDDDNNNNNNDNNDVNYLFKIKLEEKKEENKEKKENSYPIKDIMETLSLVAYKIFSDGFCKLGDIDSHLNYKDINFLLDIGIVKLENQNQCVNFIHFVFREFFIALYLYRRIRTCLNDERYREKQYLNSNCDIPNLDFLKCVLKTQHNIEEHKMVWIFLCGMSTVYNPYFTERRPFCERLLQVYMIIHKSSMKKEFINECFRESISRYVGDDKEDNYAHFMKLINNSFSKFQVFLNNMNVWLEIN